MGASTTKHFKSRIEKLNNFAETIPNDKIKKEPMFFNCDFQYAYENGGKITKSFLDSLPEDWKNQPLVFDSRVHMLMPGWFPAIPGWHHDDVPRAEIPTGQHFITGGQPDYDNMRYQSEHILGLVNAEVCPTEFALGNCLMPAIKNGELIYKQWHKEVEELIEDNILEKHQCDDRTLYYFDWQTFHTGTKAISNRWR